MWRSVVLHVALSGARGGRAGGVVQHVEEARALDPETRRHRGAPSKEVTPGRTAKFFQTLVDHDVAPY